MLTNSRLVVATRGSALALRQVAIVTQALLAVRPDLEIEVLKVTTKGDADKDRPFDQLGAKGIFMTEVERAVVTGEADVALHSAKDLTAELAEGCRIVCVPRRADARDVVLGGSGKGGEERIASLAPGARVGTSSMRRRVLVVEARKDIEVVEFRGNLDTRVQKVAKGVVDAAVVAAAGLERLDLATDAGPLDDSRWVPAPAQGALAIEARSERVDVARLFEPLVDAGATAEVTCERAFSRRLEGGCSVPLGCRAVASGSGLVVTGMLGSPYTDEVLRDRISGGPTEAEELGIELAEALLASGGDELIAEIAGGDG